MPARAARPAGGVRPARSWCSTTAPPTARPTWSARWPAATRGSRLLDGVEPRRPAGSASRRPAHQLAAAADPAAEVLVFVDADVVLAPHAVAATVGPAARQRPRPRLAVPAAARRDPGRTARPAAAAVVVADHPAAGRGRALPARRRWPPRTASSWSSTPRRLRAGRRARRGARRGARRRRACCARSSASGGRGGVVDGTDLATCRMYDGWGDLRERLHQVAVVGVRLTRRAPRRWSAPLSLLYVLPRRGRAARLAASARAGYAAGVVAGASLRRPPASAGGSGRTPWRTPCRSPRSAG